MLYPGASLRVAIAPTGRARVRDPVRGAAGSRVVLATQDDAGAIEETGYGGTTEP